MYPYRSKRISIISSLLTPVWLLISLSSSAFGLRLRPVNPQAINPPATAAAGPAGADQDGQAAGGAVGEAVGPTAATASESLILIPRELTQGQSIVLKLTQSFYDGPLTQEGEKRRLALKTEWQKEGGVIAEALKELGFKVVVASTKSGFTNRGTHRIGFQVLPERYAPLLVERLSIRTQGSNWRAINGGIGGGMAGVVFSPNFPECSEDVGGPGGWVVSPHPTAWWRCIIIPQDAVDSMREDLHEWEDEATLPH